MIFFVRKCLSIVLMIVQNQCLKVSSEEVEEYCSAFHSVDYKYNPGTLGIYRMVSGQGNEYIYY